MSKGISNSAVKKTEVNYILDSRDESLRALVSWFSWSLKRQLRSEGAEATV